MSSHSNLDSEKYFKSLESRYRQFVIHRIQDYLHHAGYKGLAFMYLLTSKNILYGVYKDTPLLRDIINSYEGAYVLDKRTAVREAVDTARRVKQISQNNPFITNQDFTNLKVDDESYAFWVNTLKNIGQDKIGYIPDPKDLLLAGADQDRFTVKFLLRYHTLRNLIRELEKSFHKDAINLEVAKSKASLEQDRLNEAVEAIGFKYHPELFVWGYKPDHGGKHKPLPEEFDKHEWLGNQVQLGELFAELERKGWIKFVKPKTVQACFTNTNSIRQVLKPGYEKTEATYPNIYKSSYKAVFDNIKKNKK